MKQLHLNPIDYLLIIDRLELCQDSAAFVFLDIDRAAYLYRVPTADYDRVYFIFAILTTEAPPII